VAKLHARGRTELARLVRHKGPAPDGSTVASRDTVALMSDGAVLQKYDVTFPANAYEGERKHSYGWKTLLKTKATAERFRAHFEAKGYTAEPGR
jgi:hypothetical protein